MEDVVAVRLKLDSGESVYLMTWGRIPEAIDDVHLLQMARRSAKQFNLGGKLVEVMLADTLQEASGQPYFYEAFFALLQRRATYGTDVAAWRSEALERMRAGKDFHFLGRNALPDSH